MEEYLGFNGEFLELIRDTNIPEAKSMLDRALLYTNPHIAEMSKRTLGSAAQRQVDKTRTALRNIFGILCNADLQPEDKVDELRLTQLRANLQKLRNSFDQFFAKQFEERPNPILAAWVTNNFNDPTVHFTKIYLDLKEIDQACTLIHERAHTVFRAPGHPGTGDSPICIVPHEGKKLGFDVATRNAYCYEWLALALHPSYDPTPFQDACKPPPRTP
ncbi:hypothetical protein [Bryobacter aggregatus]|uniref:hypothetical protein n=1 Tax=Bryobacter aggregatus TaxID=360054 RepID=UPI0004E2452A|nr:hypothetical protein [Bryobacter aggregatus]